MSVRTVRCMARQLRPDGRRHTLFERIGIHRRLPPWPAEPIKTPLERAVESIRGDLYAHQEDAHLGPAALFTAALVDQTRRQVPREYQDLDVEQAVAVAERLGRDREATVAAATYTASTRSTLRGRPPVRCSSSRSCLGLPRRLGAVRYSLCPPCGIGLLEKIEFPFDWQNFGLGRGALDDMQRRHPQVATWYTSPQYPWAIGF